MIVKTEEDRQQAIALIKSWSLDKVMEVIGREYKKNRTAAQNALAAIWCRDRGKSTGHGEEYERCYCKLTFGVPIMLRDKDFAVAWFPYQAHTYERQLSAMKIIDVTSLMSVAEFTEYLTKLQQDSHEHGIGISRPNMYDEAMG